MNQSAPKVKKRIVPTQILDDQPKSVKGALQKGEWSTRYADHHKGLYEKDAIEKIRERAVALGYEKARKVRPRSKRNDDDGDHGTHKEHLSNFGEYVKYFTSMKPHSKGVSMLDYLRKMYEKHMYLSSKTKRFRRAR